MKRRLPFRLRAKRKLYFRFSLAFSFAAMAGLLVFCRPANNFSDFDSFRTVLRVAFDKQDKKAAAAVLRLLNDKKASGPTQEMQKARLRSQTYYALDGLRGTFYLNSNNTTRWKLVTNNGRSLNAPIDMTFHQDKIYVIDTGKLYEGKLATLPLAGGQFSLKAILTEEMKVGGYPVQKIVAVDGANTSDALFVLDQCSNIYRYQINENAWRIELPKSRKYKSPPPLYVNISTYSNRLYLLDEARNQVWRHLPGELGEGFLSGKMPWLIKDKLEPDITGCVDMTIDRSIYVLFRNGDVVTYSPNETGRFNLSDANRFSHVDGFEKLPIHPSSIYTTVNDSAIYVTDTGHRRVIAIDKKSNKFISQFVAPDNPDFDALHSVVHAKNELYMLAGTCLYKYNLQKGIEHISLLDRELPHFTQMPKLDVDPGDMLPNDPRLPPVLSSYKFKMPIQKGACLPDLSAVYPGSRRLYRYGVTQGLDLATKYIGVEVNIGTSVYAAAKGLVVRADTNYEEMTIEEVNSLIKETKRLRMTPSKTLDKLGGRKVEIDHGGGVTTVYSHLSQIANGIEEGARVDSGQLIGYVGLSGTPEYIKGIVYFPHLDFGFRIGYKREYYLGQWLSIEETRRAFEQIFYDVRVRPAFLDFRKIESITSKPLVVDKEVPKAPQAKVRKKVIFTKKQPKVEPAKVGSYVVKKGETLFSLSRRFEIHVQDIKMLNNLRSNVLRAGQKLKLPRHAKNLSKGRKRNSYRVRPGDNPAKIAKRHKMSLERFLGLNRLSRRSKIHPGQKVFVEN